jgi:Flp pilus assembly protein TadD
MFETAHRTDPRSPVPLWNLWSLHVWQRRDAEASGAVARTLVELLPANPGALNALAWSLIATRRFGEAEGEIRRALAVDPLHALALPNLAHLLFRRGAAEEAAEVYREVLELSREGSAGGSEAHTTLCLGLALQRAGEHVAARRVLLDGAARLGSRDEADPLSVGARALRAAQLAAAGRTGEARRVLRDLGGREGSASLHHGLARAWAVLGERERALQHLERAVASGFDDVYFLLIDPPLALVRDDPVVDRLAPVARPSTP